MYATAAVSVSSALCKHLEIVIGFTLQQARKTHTMAKDSDVIQGITCEVGFHLVHDVGVETLSVVQLEGLDDHSVHGFEL